MKLKHVLRRLVVLLMVFGEIGVVIHHVLLHVDKVFAHVQDSVIIKHMVDKHALVQLLRQKFVIQILVVRVCSFIFQKKEKNFV